MKDKKGFEGNWALSLICLLIVIGLITFMSYVILVDVPNSKKCEELCKDEKPVGENLIKSNSPASENICHCYYSSSIKNFKLRR